MENETDMQYHASEEVSRLHAQTKNALIMMVDDEPILMDVVQSFLEAEGYTRFITCDNSSEALALIHENRPDVLLLDLIMPEVSGFDILSELSKDDSTRYIPVIVLTSSSDGNSKLQALELGAADFLGKPVDPSELILRLRNTLTVKAHQDRLMQVDDLTELLNRKTFLDRLRIQYEDSMSASLIFLGINRFKRINDSLGHKAGDRVLARVATLIRYTIEDYEGVEPLLIGRVSGDEFGVVLKHKDHDLLENLTASLVKSINAPFSVENMEIFINVSAGVMALSSADSPEDALRKGALTQKFASHSEEKYLPYSKDIDAQSAELLRLESDLRQAIARNELELHYQPKIGTTSHRAESMEALVRWRREGELIPPSVFIPIAEDTGLIQSIGQWILKQACLDTKQLGEKGHPQKVSVNVSALQTNDPKFLNSLENALTTSGLDPSQLVVELTETVVMEDAEISLLSLQSIRQLGVELSIDDFGTGYSSLSYLRRFPITELKIDQSFVSDLPDSRDAEGIVRAIIAMARSLGLTVVAEGVENEAQAEFLSQHLCDQLQGFHYGKPMPIDEYLQFCNSQISTH